MFGVWSAKDALADPGVAPKETLAGPAEPGVITPTDPGVTTADPGVATAGVFCGAGIAQPPGVAVRRGHTGARQHEIAQQKWSATDVLV